MNHPLQYKILYLLYLLLDYLPLNNKHKLIALHAEIVAALEVVLYLFHQLPRYRLLVRLALMV